MCGDPGGCGARGRARRGHDSGRGRLGAPRRSCPKGRRCPGRGAGCRWDPVPGHAGGVRRGSLAWSSRRAAPPHPARIAGPAEVRAAPWMLSPEATLGRVGRGRPEPPGVGPPHSVFVWRTALGGTTAWGPCGRAVRSSLRIACRDPSGFLGGDIGGICGTERHPRRFRPGWFCTATDASGSGPRNRFLRFLYKRCTSSRVSFVDPHKRGSPCIFRISFGLLGFRAVAT